MYVICFCIITSIPIIKQSMLPYTRNPNSNQQREIYPCSGRVACVV